MNNTIYGGTTVTPVPLNITDQEYNPESENAQSGKAVAEATQNLAPAIKGAALGQTVVLDDISPIAHELKVKVSAPPKVEEVETSIPVDISKLVEYVTGEPFGTGRPVITSVGPTYTTTTLREIVGDALSVGDFIKFKFKCYGEHNIGLATNLTTYNPETDEGGDFYVDCYAPSIYSGDYSGWDINEFGAGETEGISREFAVTEDVLKSTFLFSCDAYENPGMYVYDLEIIKIGYETTYPDYTKVTLTANGDTYTPQEDGTVLGVRSQYPTLSLSAHSEEVEDITITCEYNKDTNKVLGDIETLLGGI